MRAKEFIVEGVNQVDFNKNLLNFIQQTSFIPTLN